MLRCRYVLSLPVAVLAALALAAGCSGQAAAPGDQQAGAATLDTAAPAAQPAGMPPLPAPGAISRGASLIETGLTLQGSSFRPDLTHQNIRVEGDLCVFDPSFLSGDSPQYSDVALSIFSFSLLDSSSDPVDVSLLSDFSLDGELDLVIGTAHVFAGFPSLSLDKWEWTEMQISSSPGGQPHSFVWSMTCPDELQRRAPEGLLNVCIVVFGDTELSCSRVAFALPGSTSNELSFSTIFHKGWDGTIKGRTAFDQSVSLCVDDSSTVHCSYYDSSNGQLYHLRVDDRVVTTQAVDCDLDSGLTNDLICTPDGRLLLSYWQDSDDDGLGDGLVRDVSLDQPTFFFSEPVTFASGRGNPGLPPSDVGSRSSFVWDSQRDLPCIFHEDRSSGRISLAQSSGTPMLEWINQYVTPSGLDATRPKGVFFQDYPGVVYIADTDNNRMTSNGFVLCYTVNGTDWSSSTLRTDVHNPNPLDPDCPGYCDVEVRGDLLICAYSSSSGGTLSVFDISDPAAPMHRSSVVFDPSPSSGAFCDLEVMDDLSVRLVHSNVFDSTLNFVYSSSVADPSFTCESVALSLLDDDEDCDDLDFVVCPDDDGDGFYEAVLVTLSSSFSALTQQRKRELTGHVTLIK